MAKEYYHIDATTANGELRFSYQTEELRDKLLLVLENNDEVETAVSTDSDKASMDNLLRGIAFANDVVEAMKAQE